MMKHWQQLLPVDQYQVMTKGMLGEYDRKIITLLYQPLIGPLSVSLYMTLWSEIESNRLWSKDSNHYCLMNMMGLSLKEIYEARSRLEGIGLLKVYKQSSQEATSLLYELMAPLNPEQFFTDGMLNVYLYKKIGKSQFAKLKHFFSDEAMDVKGYQETTKTFPEVFASSHLDSLYVSEESRQDLEVEHGQSFVSRMESQELDGFAEHFDFGLFFAGMKSTLISEKAFTKDIQMTIAKLSYIYGINPIAMQSIVMRAVISDDEIDMEELRRAARDWYQIEYNQELPSLVEQVQPIKYRHTEKPKTKEEEWIQHLEQVSPRELLIQYGGGVEPTLTELKIVEEVMIEQKLLPGVMNVLIEYVMIKNDRKFPKAYVKTIASHWARKNVKTVKAAMDLAKKEYEKDQKRNSKQKQSYSKTKKVIRTEIVPDWLKDAKNRETNQIEADHSNTKETEENADFLAEKEKLEAELREKY
ncbi:MULTISPECIES: replication initiation and membrane attachment family protein [Bacillus]|uniref:replication initiation and membrane attachment family protein n=1 Tax=Bacillus TaxID=1386 RepID=UPI0002EF6ECC|nr:MULTISPECIES: replication initiation and membrane attachment family protein [Bacillus]